MTIYLAQKSAILFCARYRPVDTQVVVDLVVNKDGFPLYFDIFKRNIGFIVGAIKAHLVIVFAGLAITRFIEIKTNLSIKRVIKTISKVLTHKVNPFLKEKILVLFMGAKKLFLRNRA